MYSVSSDLRIPVTDFTTYTQWYCANLLPGTYATNLLLHFKLQYEKRLGKIIPELTMWPFTRHYISSCESRWEQDAAFLYNISWKHFYNQDPRWLKSNLQILTYIHLVTRYLGLDCFPRTWWKNLLLGQAAGLTSSVAFFLYSGLSS